MIIGRPIFSVVDVRGEVGPLIDLQRMAQRVRIKNEVDH